MCWWQRLAVCSITCSVAASTSRVLKCWSSTKRTGCSTWASSMTSKTIVAATPDSRQTLLFSATLDWRWSAKLAQRMTKSPKRIEITPAKARHENIEQRLHFADDLAHKNRLLQHLLPRLRPLTKRWYLQQPNAMLTRSPTRFAPPVSRLRRLHGDMRQGERNRTLNAVRTGGNQDSWLQPTWPLAASTCRLSRT